MCMVRPRSSTNWRSGCNTTPSIIAGLNPSFAVLLDLHVCEGGHFGALVIGAIPVDRLPDRVGVVPGRLPVQVMVRAVTVELQPVVLVRCVWVAFDFDLAAAPQLDDVADHLA